MTWYVATLLICLTTRIVSMAVEGFSKGAWSPTNMAGRTHQRRNMDYNRHWLSDMYDSYMGTGSASAYEYSMSRYLMALENARRDAAPGDEKLRMYFRSPSHGI
ncbi:hypothetical protein BaRGS_00040285 [Batillaria attramentaria]|uniref:Secreted protein n=1 Tax=Batillaria attramentaria TaxID=370345 RepID=A0ABD0J0R7_9CAEN